MSFDLPQVPTTPPFRSDFILALSVGSRYAICGILALPLAWPISLVRPFSIYLYKDFRLLQTVKKNQGISPLT